MVDFRDPDSIISEIQDIMSDPNYVPITGPVSLVNALEQAKKIRVNRGTIPIDGSIPTFRFRQGSGGSRGARGTEPSDAVVQQAMEILTNDDSVVLDSGLVEMINDPEFRMTRDGEMTRRTGRDVIRRSGQFSRSAILPNLRTPRRRRKAKNTAYRRAYKAAFKRLKPSKMTKSGKWKKGGFKQVVQAAHKAARKATKK